MHIRCEIASYQIDQKKFQVSIKTLSQLEVTEKPTQTGLKQKGNQLAGGNENFKRQRGLPWWRSG